MPTRTRAALVAALALVTCGVLAAPASATTSSPGSVMNQDPSVMSPGEALLVFVGIPAVVVALVWLLVSAPGWTRAGRPTDSEAWTGEPVVVGAGASAAAIAAEGGEAAAEVEDADAAGSTGGTSAAW
ncbi:MAG: hypothetical protein U0R76_00700 [Candidatus Nanopelagicales bacterium]